MTARWVLLLLLIIGAAACDTLFPPSQPTSRVVFVTATPVEIEPSFNPAPPSPTVLALPPEHPTAAIGRSPAPTAPFATGFPAPAQPKPVPEVRTTVPVPTTAPPGIYVTALRVSPAKPIKAQPVTFTAAFLNTTPGPAALRFLVLVYMPEQRNSIGETSPIEITVPPGESEFSTPNNWSINPANCEPYLAQAGWFDAENRLYKFTTTEGEPLSAGFQVCPP